MGKVLECWKDKWISNIGPFFNHITSHANMDLRELVTEDNSWNMNLFRVWLPKDVIRHIVSIPPPHPLVGPDKIAWVGPTSRSFSIESAYQMLRKGVMEFM